MSQRHSYERIRRKENVPESVQTQGKDQAAQIIQEKIDNGEWPVPLTELADETEWSRSHYQNTIKDYFETVDETPEPKPVMNGELTIPIPGDVDKDSYVRGWIEGYMAQ